ncbi:hypothetical protein HispidOSU_020096 [Sigmodon hispidus]
MRALRKGDWLKIGAVTLMLRSLILTEERQTLSKRPVHSGLLVPQPLTLQVYCGVGLGDGPDHRATHCAPRVLNAPSRPEGALCRAGPAANLEIHTVHRWFQIRVG